MPLTDLIGLDHVVVVVRDLARAEQTWQRLGFTISPRGTHSAHMGTGNHTLMFGDDYMELLGVLTPTERNAPTRALLEKREGLERAAFTTRDAAAGVAALQARGIAATGPIAFSRAVDLPDGSKTEARFDTYLWPLTDKPAGMRIFACQQHTRAAVWLPHLQKHRNTADKIIRVELVAADPAAAAAHMARLIGQSVQATADGAWRVESGGTRGVFEFLDHAGLRTRHPGVPPAQTGDDCATTLVLHVADLAAAKAAVAGLGAIDGPGRITVPASQANGVTLVLEG
jgi:catechol 2,3-dioxygenase-like lactoylglutathione lyase family enzyme